MKLIDSFKKDHNVLEPGLYMCAQHFPFLYTWDLRFIKPNSGWYPSPASLHSLEHLVATYFKTVSQYKERIISFNCGMCLTMGYLETTSDLTKEEVAYEIVSCNNWASHLTKVPGAHKKECGNYRAHNLSGAKQLLHNYALLLQKQFRVDLPVL